MADKFMSGDTTAKYEVPLPSHIKESMSTVNNNIMQLNEQINNLDNAINEIHNIHIPEINNSISKIVHDAEYYVHDNKYLLNPLAIQFLLSWPMRFLNNIFHWYKLYLNKEKYSDIVIGVGYYINIIPVTYDMYSTQRITPGKDFMSEEYNDELTATFRESMKLFKDHLKEAKEDGWNLKKIIKYTCIRMYM